MTWTAFAILAMFLYIIINYFFPKMHILAIENNYYEFRIREVSPRNRAGTTVDKSLRYNQVSLRIIPLVTYNTAQIQTRTHKARVPVNLPSKSFAFEN